MCSKVLEISGTILVYIETTYYILLYRVSYFFSSKQAPLYLQAYLWKDDKAMVEWLTEQIREDSIDNTVSDNIRCLQKACTRSIGIATKGGWALFTRTLRRLDCQGQF